MFKPPKLVSEVLLCYDIHGMVICMDNENIFLNELLNYAKLLNSKEIFKEDWFRRNTAYYPLITYINHTIAFYVGMNYDGVVAIFIRRAAKELDCLINERGFHEKYFDIAEEYLYKITAYLMENNLSEITESIPEKFRKRYE